MTIPGSANPLLLKSAAAAGPVQIERSLRFNSSDSASLSRVSYAGSGTFSCWVKRCKLGTAQTIISGVAFNASDQLNSSTAVFRDPSAWMHVLVSTSGTYVNGTSVASGSAITPGIIGSGCDLYLADIYFIDGQDLTPSSFTEVSATTGQLIPKAYTGSFGTNGFWLKFSDNSSLTSGSNVGVGKDYSGNANYFDTSGLSVVGVVSHVTGGLSYRDSSSTNQTWDASSTSSSTSNAIGPDRRWWVDLGSSKSFNRITFNVVASGQSADTSTNFVINFSTTSNSGGSSICGGGCTVTSASRPSGATPGTIAVTFAGFTSQTGRYIAISSGSGAQGGTYTYSNLQIYDDQGKDNDSLVDTPTSYGTDTGAGGEVRGNYATLNPLQKGSDLTLSNGNLDLSKSSTVDKSTASTIGMTSGKWYFELAITNLGGGEYAIGFGRNIPIESYVGSNATTWSYADTGLLMHNANTTSYGSSYTTGDVLGAAFDGDNGTLVFYKNGVSQGTAATGLTQGPYFFTAGAYQSTATRSANFGQRAFAYTAPSGFKALCDTNLISTTITTSGSYTGNGTADGPFVYLNGVPTAMTIGGNAVTFGTHADKLANGFKIRTSSTTYNQNASSYSYSITSTGAAFKNARAQPNP